VVDIISLEGFWIIFAIVGGVLVAGETVISLVVTDQVPDKLARTVLSTWRISILFIVVPVGADKLKVPVPIVVDAAVTRVAPSKPKTTFFTVLLPV